MGFQDFTGENFPMNEDGTPGSIPVLGIPIPLNNNTSTNDTEPDVSDLLINYNKRFKLSDPILFRDSITNQVLSILVTKNKPNALLVGPAGTGKTKIVEDIARLLATGNVLIPDCLKEHIIYELPLSNIVSGSKFVGDLEKKIKSVIDFASNPDNKAIIFIDEIHQLVGGTNNEQYTKIAQILKPALARGDFRCIGATTTQEATALTSDPAFNRRFSRIIVNELTPKQTVEIVQKTSISLMKHYVNVVVDNAICEKVVQIADQFKTAGSHRPDNAVTLLDRAMGDAIIERKIAEQNATTDPNVAAVLASNPPIHLTERKLKTTAVRIMTGVETMHDFDEMAIRDKLKVIHGQNDIIDTLIDMLKRRDLALFPSTKPMTLLFAGSSGVGKTEITKIISREITGCEPIILNMTEYNNSAAINRIIGAPAGYVGSDSNAELPFDSLSSNPYKVILLDEFEKCDKAVQRLFMSAFDEGYIKTNKGTHIDFSKSIIIATTNATHKEIKNSLGFTNGTDHDNKTDVKELSQWFDTELLNRFTKILTFRELGADIYRQIVADLYEREVARIKNVQNISIADTIPSDALDKIVSDTYVVSFGARPARKAVEEFIQDAVIASRLQQQNLQTA